jgi:flagellar hook protein FlgE
MLRSLYSGISGLRNHQVTMDVVSNNIANVNTVGFKSGRVTFEEAMAQLLKGSSRPPGNAGGTNPMQIGLGMNVGSVDTLMTQGNLQSTGQVTDLAIEGRGFFAYSNGEERLFSRNGALQFDSTGRMVSPTNGFGIQGLMADATGNYPPGTKVGDIRIPYGEKSPAHATSDVKFSSNLDSDSGGLGTISHTNRFLAAATGNPVNPANSDLLTSLFDSNGNSLGIKSGDIMTLSCYDGNAGVLTPLTQTFAVTASSTYQDLSNALGSFLQTNITLGGAQIDTRINNVTGTLDVDMTSATTAKVNNLSITSNRPGSKAFVTNMFQWGSTTLSGGGLIPYSSHPARAPAESTDLISNLFDAQGQVLNLEANDVISINGSIGGKPIPQSSLPPFDPLTTTMSDLLQKIQASFNLPDRDGTPANNPSVEINPANNGDQRIPVGAIVIRGQPELAFALGTISFGATNSNLNSISPTPFIANMITTDIQQARDTGKHSTSITVYDESGDSHVLTTTFTHSGRASEWLWEITMSGEEKIISGSRGRITFGQDGSPSSFSFDDGTSTFRFNPMNGSNAVSVSMDIGKPGSFQGITQFRSPTTTAAREQNGYPMGKLSEISIDEFGEVHGVFTNGVNKAIARVLIAEFNNPAGLQKVGDSMFSTSNNSGEGVLLQAGVGTSSKVKPGSLEMSNVELANEFTSLITTQRGYQANARVITTSDQMLQELVQLVR